MITSLAPQQSESRSKSTIGRRSRRRKPATVAPLPVDIASKLGLRTDLNTRVDDPLCDDPKNPWRPVDWRWRRAIRQLGPETTLTRRRLRDRFVHKICRYLARKAEGRPPRKSELGLAQAEAIWRSEESRQRALLQAWLLTGLTPAEVAQRTGLPLSVVNAYRLAFFDVASRTQSHSFVVHKVLNLHGRDFKTLAEAEHVTWQLDATFYGAEHLAELLTWAALLKGIPVTGSDADLEKLQKVVRYLMHVVNTVTPATAPLKGRSALAIFDRLRRLEFKRAKRLRRMGAALA